jgi:hypothetical protein
MLQDQKPKKKPSKKKDNQEGLEELMGGEGRQWVSILKIGSTWHTRLITFENGDLHVEEISSGPRYRALFKANLALKEIVKAEGNRSVKKVV